MVINSSDKSPFEIRDSTGKEFKEIYDSQGRLLFKNWNEIQGSPPITFRGYRQNLTECRIYGNTVQNGTPSPKAPVDVVGCGVRTGNTMPSPTASTETKNGITCTCYGNGKITIRGTASAFTQFVFSVPEFTIPVSVGQGGGGTFSMFNSFASSSIVIIFYDGNTKIDNWSFSQINRTDMMYAVMGGKRVTMMQLNVSGGISVDGQFSLMFTDDGQSPDKYEPYGYKIPISSGGKNLLDESASSDADATHINYNKDAPIILTAGQTYTLSCNTVCNGLYIRSAADDSNLASTNNSNTLTYTPQVNVRAYCRVWNSNGITNLNPMLNCGSTQLPYEPYNRTTTPVYLGEVPTTRKIKKLVLTGEEGDWGVAGEWSTRLYNHTIGTGISYSSEALCNVAEYSDSVTTSSGEAFDIVAYQGNLVIRFHAINYATLNDFKSYLAAQYAAGTPVTVWYVLAEPETAIVNEPIQKIGDYSDELSIADIPTINGINTISADTTVQPSGMYLKGKIKPVT